MEHSYKNNGFGDWVRSILAEVHNLISCGGNPFRTRCRTPRTALQTNKFPPTATGKGHMAFLKAPERDEEGEMVHAVWMRRFDPRRTNAEGDGVATVHTDTDRQAIFQKHVPFAVHPDSTAACLRSCCVQCYCSLCFAISRGTRHRAV